MIDLSRKVTIGFKIGDEQKSFEVKMRPFGTGELFAMQSEKNTLTSEQRKKQRDITRLETKIKNRQDIVVEKNLIKENDEVIDYEEKIKLIKEIESIEDEIFDLQDELEDLKSFGDPLPTQADLFEAENKKTKGYLDKTVIDDGGLFAFADELKISYFDLWLYIGEALKKDEGNEKEDSESGQKEAETENSQG